MNVKFLFPRLLKEENRNTCKLYKNLKKEVFKNISRINIIMLKIVSIEPPLFLFFPLSCIPTHSEGQTYLWLRANINNPLMVLEYASEQIS